MAITYNVRPDKVKEIPTPTHVDNTARIQTVAKGQNGLYLHDLISNFEMETGVPVITNTSLNVMNQPICLSPGRRKLYSFRGPGWDLYQVIVIHFILALSFDFISFTKY